MIKVVKELVLKIEDNKFIRCQKIERHMEITENLESTVFDEVSFISAEEFVRLVSKVSVPDMPIRFEVPRFKEL